MLNNRMIFIPMQLVGCISCKPTVQCKCYIRLGTLDLKALLQGKKMATVVKVTHFLETWAFLHSKRNTGTCCVEGHVYLCYG